MIFFFYDKGVHSSHHKHVMLLVADLYKVRGRSTSCDDCSFAKDFAEKNNCKTEVADPLMLFQVW